MRPLGVVFSKLLKGKGVRLLLRHGRVSECVVITAAPSSLFVEHDNGQREILMIENVYSIRDAKSGEPITPINVRWL